MEGDNSNILRSVNILGVKIQEVDLATLVDSIVMAGERRSGSVVEYVNVQSVNLAYQQNWFRKFINDSDLVFCDGFGVRWAAKFLYGVRLHRHTPPDWFPILAHASALKGLSMYFLGAKPGVVEKASAVLRAAIPDLCIVGMHDGYFDPSPDSIDQQTLLEEINRLKPDILVIGFGMPKQERWILENRSRLDVGVYFPVGAMFDYIADAVPRAPLWMTDHGLEWLGRLVIEPGRLWQRYILGNPLFVWRILLQKMNYIRVQNY